MFFKNTAKATLVCSLALFFIKEKLFGLTINLSDILLLISFVASGIVFLQHQNKKALLLAHKSILLFTGTLGCLLVLATITSLALYHDLPWSFIIREYVRLITSLLLFLEIIIYARNDHRLLAWILYASFTAFLVIPFAYFTTYPSIGTIFLDSSLYRFAGLFSDPNYFAQFSILPLSLVLSLAYMRPRYWEKFLWFVIFAVYSALLIWSGSRGGWAGIIVAVTLFTIMISLQKGWKAGATVVAIIIVGFVLGYVALPYEAKMNIQERTTIFIGSQPGGTAKTFTLTRGQSRGLLWQQGAKYIAHDPLGYGPGYAQIINLVESGGGHGNVQSIVLETVLTGGILAFCLLLYGLYRLFLPYTRSALLIMEKTSPYIYAVIAAFAGIIVASLFIDSLNMKYTWVLAAVTYCCAAALQSNQQDV